MESFDESGESLAVEAHGLTKTFGTVQAVRGVDMAIPRGSVYGFLGPNGAGKTTTIRILTTLTKPDSGTAYVLGLDLLRERAAVRRQISLTSQFASLDQDLTGFENLVVLGRLLGLSWRGARHRARELLDAFELAEAGGRTVATLSGGMRRRLDIAASLIVPVDLLFLDEPTTGLDPRSRRHVWDVVQLIAERGTTVLLTTQDLQEADQLAQRIALIDRGQIIAEGSGADLKAAVGAGHLRLRVRRPEQRPAAVQILARSLQVAVQGDADPLSLSARVTTDAEQRLGHALVELAHEHISVGDFSFSQPSLDEVFLTLTGRPRSDDVEEQHA